ncbi:MAG: hypothetical protein F9K29_10755 [Hyphomicrobiaceae bacterium]|nr:MAG: hypothetical protein F9K29_10755 [Hyphomicrobiaceae bacterium]
MDQLTRELRRTAKFREAAISDMRHAVSCALTTCATMRGKMVRQYRGQTQKFLASLVKDVAACRNATMNHIARLSSARRRTASQLRSSLRRQAGALAKDTQELRGALTRAREQMAEYQQGALAAGREKLRKDMARFVGRAHADRIKAREIWGAFRADRAS